MAEQPVETGPDHRPDSAAPRAPQPVLADPDRFGEGWDEDRECVTHDGAGWDLSSGCRITITHDRDEVGRPQEWTATVSTFGEDRWRGITVRTVTPQQVEAYARHLLAVVAEHGAGEDPARDPHRLANWSRARMIRYVQAAWFEAHETEWILAEALGYPRGDGDVLPVDEFATGDHTVVTLAAEAAGKLSELAAGRGPTPTPTEESS